MRVPLLVLSLMLVACGEPDDPSSTPADPPEEAPDPAPPTVRVEVPTVFLLVGETLAVSASTANGDDAGYAWTSSDDHVASVEGGVVTGRAQGEVTITATGTDTEASGSVDLYVAYEVPHQAAWSASAHADVRSPSFTRWDEDGAVPVGCARCHSTTGLRDYLGDDGSDPHSVDHPAPTGEGVQCMACHNPTAAALDEVTFPSGVALGGQGPDAVCMTCHQGRASGDRVDQVIADAEAVEAPDAVDPDLSFTHLHYGAAAATVFGGVIRGGYGYDAIGSDSPFYDVRFRHVEGYDTCTGCHDPHSLQVRVDSCATCHPGVQAVEDLRDVRMAASEAPDYDGDGNRAEGLYHEVQGLRQSLYDALQAYAHATPGADDLCWSPDSYPYFFADTDGSGGDCDPAEASFSNQYTTWTPRLLKAAYNFQLVSKDKGAYAHNGKYAIQLLHDGIRDLQQGLEAPVVALGDREDPGHFNGASRSFRNWDNSGQVGASCSRCHGGATGFLFHTTFGVSLTVGEPANGLECATCHPAAFFSDPSTPALVSVSSVAFPGGATLAAGQMFHPSDALCATCHSGRQGTDSIDGYLAGTSNPSFRNVHYLPAAGLRYGSEARVGYQYPDRDYVGARGHMPANANSQCTFCHDPADTAHTFRAEERLSFCINCHSDAASVEQIRWFGNTVDYNGNGDVSELLSLELASFKDALLVAMRDYAVAAGDAAPCYAPSNPFWYVGEGPYCTPAEAVSGNGFSGWDAALVRASHNFQLVHKDRGAWAHNIEYAMQLLYDSVEALGGDTGTLVRPE